MGFALRIDDPHCRKAVERVRRLVAGEGGRALLVGGCVRDAVLGRPVRDVDIEVFGIPRERLEAMLRKAFRCRIVGAAFPVIVLYDLPIDVAVPRVPGADFATASARRDFTLNAMGWDLDTERLLDPHGGRVDLEARTLRHTSHHFAEDPLRVLRGMQLAARFDLTGAPETVELCRTLTPEGLPVERIQEEWRKLLLRGERISRGLEFLKACGWLRYFPELEALVGCPQSPEHHPEGDVWVHTLHCLDAFAQERSGDDREDLIVGLAVLCHDLGKPATTVTEVDGRITSKRHEALGEEITPAFLARITRDNELLREVPKLVAHHLAPSRLYKERDRARDAAVRRLAGRAGNLERLIRVAAADHAGRPPRPAKPFEAGEWLRERARALDVRDSAPEPLLKGRHLVEMGLEPGPRFGEILDAVYEAQLEGEVQTLEDGMRLVANTQIEDQAPDPRDDR